MTELFAWQVTGEAGIKSKRRFIPKAILANE